MTTDSKLYKLNNSNKDGTSIYARDPAHIIELVEHYMKRLTPEQLNDPESHNIQTWVKKTPTMDDILEVESGNVIFQAGMIDMTLKGNLFKNLQVTDDFVVNVNLESLPYFDQYRSILPDNKRCQLYKFSSPGGLFQNQNFIPEDVMRAIYDFDLISHFEEAKETLHRLSKMNEHPNVKLGFREV